MNQIELVERIESSDHSLSIFLFQDRSSGEGLVMAREVAPLMGYRSITGRLKRNPGCLEKIHFSLLHGQPLRDLKSCLQEHRIDRLKRSNRLFLLTETGVSFFLAMRCKEKALRAGEWLLSEVFPKLRPSLEGTWFQKIDSLYLEVPIYLIYQGGRLGIFASHLSALLRLPEMDHIVKGCYGYVENVHVCAMGQGTSLDEIFGLSEVGTSGEDTWLLHESGLYRYLRHTDHPLTVLVKVALEREIFPVFRRWEGHWVNLNLQENTRSERFEFRHEKNEVSMRHDLELPASYSLSMADPHEKWEGGHLSSILSSILEKLENLESRFAEFNRNLERTLHDQELKWESLKQESLHPQKEKSMLLEKRDKGSDCLEKRDMGDAPEVESGNAPLPRLTLDFLKKVASDLQVFYLDRVTPHVVFAQVLIGAARNTDSDYLKSWMEREIGIQYGLNKIEMKGSTYHVWKR